MRLLSCPPELADTARVLATTRSRSTKPANTILVASRKVDRRGTRSRRARRPRGWTSSRRTGPARGQAWPRSPTPRHRGVDRMLVASHSCPHRRTAGLRRRCVIDSARVVMGGGNRSSKIVLDPTQLLKLPNVEVHRPAGCAALAFTRVNSEKRPRSPVEPVAADPGT